MDTQPEPDSAQLRHTLTNVWRIHQYINRLLDKHLSEHHGLDWRSYVALKLIEQGVVSPGVIAEAMNIPAYVVSRSIEPLLEQHLIERRFDPQDARRTRLALTESGQACVREASATLHAVITSYTSSIPPERRALMVEIIDELARSIPPA